MLTSIQREKKGDEWVEPIYLAKPLDTEMSDKTRYDHEHAGKKDGFFFI